MMAEIIRLPVRRPRHIRNFQDADVRELLELYERIPVESRERFIDAIRAIAPIWTTA